MERDAGQGFNSALLLDHGVLGSWTEAVKLRVNAHTGRVVWAVASEDPDRRIPVRNAKSSRPMAFHPRAIEFALLMI